MNCRLRDKHPVVRTHCHRKKQVKESLLGQTQSWSRSPLSRAYAQVSCGSFHRTLYIHHFMETWVMSYIFYGNTFFKKKCVVSYIFCGNKVKSGIKAAK